MECTDRLRMRGIRFFLIAAGAVGLTATMGCKTLPPQPPLVETLAVLPFDNETNNLNASDIMQNLVIRALKQTPYKVLEPQIVTDTLEAAGITDGGQLPAVDPTKLGRDLGVQALMYGYVTSFSYVNLGFYLQRKVGLELKLVDVQTGQTLWENSGAASTMRLATDAKTAGDNFAKGVADQALEKIIKTPLHAETLQSTEKALRTLPGFVFRGYAADKSGSENFKTETNTVIRGQIWKE